MILRTSLFALVLGLLWPVEILAAAASWKIGAASIAITPDLPMWMSGYGARKKPGEQVAVPLHAKALAIDDAAGGRVVIVTTDLLGIPRVLRQAVETEAQRRFGLAREQLLLNASHTHSGPELRGVKTSLNDLDPVRSKRVAAYQAEVQEKIVTVIAQALERRQPATLAFSKARAGFAMNRRKDYSLTPESPGYNKVPNPYGPVDHDVPVLVATDSGVRTQAILFGYACHNTTSGDYAFHGDYAGFAQANLEETYPGVVALFMTGCGGDQNPYPRGPMVPGQSAIELARRHGVSLASAVAAALNAHPRPLQGSIASRLEDVALPYLTVPTRAELEERTRAKNEADRDYAQVLLEWLTRDGRLPDHYSYPVQVIHFGRDLALVGLASETVVDFSLRLKRELAMPAVWVAGYCNDFMGYIPSRRIWEEGGYEGGGAMTYWRDTMYRVLHPNKWDSSVEDRIVGKVHDLHRQLAGPPR